MIAAIVLAAGQSKRMGRPKMTLAWGESTVLGRVIQVFRAAGVEDVVVVTGGDREAAEKIARQCDARTAFNARYAEGEMLSSIQVGVSNMKTETAAAFIALGDQPQILEGTVRQLMDEYSRSSAPLIVPSYEMRRGHPWLVARELWGELLNMSSTQTPRDFLQDHAEHIHYVSVGTPTVLADLDTPDEYLRSRP